MSIQTVYLRATSKKAANESLAHGMRLYAESFGNGGYIDELPVGTVVKIYEKIIGGNPYAKAYANIVLNKQGQKVLK